MHIMVIKGLKRRRSRMLPKNEQNTRKRKRVMEVICRIVEHIMKFVWQNDHLAFVDVTL